MSTSKANQILFDNLIVFGDSLSDTGNVFQVSEGTLPPSPPYAEGRFSNGDLIIDIIAEAFELPGSESFLLGGNNFAFVAAQTGEGSTETEFSGFLPEPIDVPNIALQIDLYLSAQTPTDTDLFYIYGGGNDFLDAFSEGTTTQIAESVVGNISDHITKLAAAGAETFIVPNLPSLGILPLFSDQPPEAVALLDNVTNEFNQLLDQELDAIAAELEVTIIEPDFNSVVDEIITNPEQFGLINTTESVLDITSGTLIGNPDQLFFWDFLHPTTAANEIIATEAISLIVEEITGIEAEFGTVAADIIEVEGSSQLIFAEDGNDLIDASPGGGNNRIYGGSGDDTLILGTGDRIFGDAGDDSFFFTSGVDNTVTGGAGADQFWIATAEIPDAPNTITDFTVSEDLIGIAGLGIGFAGVNLTQQGDDALIAVTGSDLAILENIDVTSLSANDFVFG
ncbi:MAG: SGNH/GDSL hydrolase family protein [Cyanobacteria bacterium J06558_2]